LYLLECGRDLGVVHLVGRLYDDSYLGAAGGLHHHAVPFDKLEACRIEMICLYAAGKGDPYDHGH